MVDNSGTKPVSASTACATRSDRAPGGVTKAFARNLHLHFAAQVKMPTTAPSLGLHPPDQIIAVMGIVEADIHRCAALGRDHVGRRVAGVDGDDGQRRRVEMLGAVIQFAAGQTVHQPRHRGQRIPGAVRIGRMALHAGQREPRRERSRAARS